MTERSDDYVKPWDNLKKALRDKCPHKIDIGAVFTAPVRPPPPPPSLSPHCLRSHTPCSTWVFHRVCRMYRLTSMHVCSFVICLYVLCLPAAQGQELVHACDIHTCTEGAFAMLVVGCSPCQEPRPAWSTELLQTVCLPLELIGSKSVILFTEA